MKGSHIQPLFDNVLVAPVKEDTKTPGGILLPESAKEKPQIGTVMAVGPGITSKHTGKPLPIVVKKGDKILYKKWGGNEVKVGNEEWTILEQKDILAIVK